MVDIHNHEDEGIKIATVFLAEHKVKDEIIAGIKGCITATKMPQSPKNLMEEIVADADLFH